MLNYRFKITSFTVIREDNLMIIKICFGIVIMSFIGAIIERLLLEKDMNSLVILVFTLSIMIFAIIAIEAASRGEKRLRF